MIIFWILAFVVLAVLVLLASHNEHPADADKRLMLAYLLETSPHELTQDDYLYIASILRKTI